MPCTLSDTARPLGNRATAFRRIIAGIAALAFATAVALAPARANDSVQPSAEQVWLVNTRCAPSCGDLEAGMASIAYARLDAQCGCGSWQTSDAAAFQASATPGVPTIVLVHGNGSDEDWAVRHGNELLCLLRRVACGRAYRLVVWSWPADRVVRQLRTDVQIKVCRSDTEAYYLARLLHNLPKGTPLSLLGYSLGCRAVSGTLQLLAGGVVAGRSLAPANLAVWSGNGPRPMRMMLLAAAMDCNWLEPGCPRGLAPLAVERILVSSNDGDRVLKWYSRLYGRNGPEAMGYVGPAGAAGGKIEMVNVACEVGRKHDFDRYHEASSVYQRLAWYTFLCDPPAIPPVQAAQSGEKPSLAGNQHSAR